MKSEVSIIIPTYNSAATLGHCLRSIYSQSYSSFEIIVVDNLSNDETVKVAAEFGAKIIVKRSTPALARNLGVANSLGKYVFFIDSDQILSTSLIEECVKNCEREGAAMVRVPEVFVGHGSWGTCSAVWKNYGAKAEKKRGASGLGLTGEPRFFVKELLTRVGLLDPTLLWGEDYDLYKKLKKMGIKETRVESELYHYESASIRTILLKNLRYGKSIPTFMQSSKEQILSPIMWQSLLTLREIIKDPNKSPEIVLGCAFLFGLKAFVLIIGFSTGLR
jgi:GT2 family glycosyltransferase